MHGSEDLLELPVNAFLDSLAAEEPAPAGGSGAAVAVAMGAALLAKVARASTGWPEASSVIAQAERLRKRTAPLAQRDAEAYEQALAALHLPDQLEPEVRSLAIGQVVGRAAEVPLVIAEAGADVATLAVLVADRGVADRRGDAVAAALLAESGARAAANLVAVNLTMRPEDERVHRAKGLAQVASAAARTALTSPES